MIARRQVFRLGGTIALGILCVPALAACVETKVVTREVPVERIVVQEVPVEKVVTREVERLVRVEVPVERVVIREVPVERIVTREVEEVVRVEVSVETVVTKEVPVEKIVIAEVTEAVEEATDDRICEIDRKETVERVVNREFPSVFGAWSHLLLNLPIPEDKWEVEYVERTRAYHDLFVQGLGFGLQWASTPQGMRVVGPWWFAQEQNIRLQAQNPHWIYLVSVNYYGDDLEDYPKDWPHWLRDESGNRVADEDWGSILIDFTHPEVQDLFVQQAIAIAKCGTFDGIFLDWWSEEDEWNEEHADFYYGDKVDTQISILRRIREAVGDEFLILVNSRLYQIPRSAPYVNGAFMEGISAHWRDDPSEYLAVVENALLWAEDQFSHPQINSLEGWGIPTEPLDSPRNQQWMRVFTTLSLTHSDGYISYVTGFASLNHEHHYEIWEGHSGDHVQGDPHDHTHDKSWHSFWDAPLGRPVSERGRLHADREGLFIREFSNGWAVYNRSGSAQEIELPERATGVHSGVSGTSHTLPDLDGEIYIKGSDNAG